MNIRASILLGALLAASTLVACDPYETAKGGAPAIIGAQVNSYNADAYDNSDYAAAYPSVAGVAGATPGSWTITSDAADKDVIQLFFNKLLNGASVQTSPTDCTPAGSWLTVTPAPASGCAWYSCYQPSSPSAAQGATVYLFQACGPVTATDGVYDVAAPLPAGTTHLTGEVKDKDGNAAKVDVTVTVPAA